MKKLLAVLVLVLFASVSFAQWTTAPGNVWLQSAGNVGIGTVAPAQLLHMYNATKSTIQVESGYTAVPGVVQTLGSIVMKGNGGDQFIFAFRKLNSGSSDVLQSAGHSTYPGGFAEFQYFNFGTQKWEMKKGVIDAEFQNSGILYINNGTPTGVFDPLVSGKVGIGTTAILAGVKLQVGGKVKCQEVEVAVTPWPDHVFKTGYNLMPLDQVENFVNTNKHLPGVPSEEEVAANGVNVGQMNATLLQKVEELTLYMIKLQKEVDALKAK